MTEVKLHKKTRSYGRVFSLENNAGFTLVELVVTLVVLGILASIAMPKFFGASSFESMGYTDSAATAARYAQKLAMNTGCETRFEITSAGFSIWQRESTCNSGDFTRAVVIPGGGAWAELTPVGVSVTALDLFFDADGSPHLTSDGTLFSSTRDFTVDSRSIRIEPITGLVHQL